MSAIDNAFIRAYTLDTLGVAAAAGGQNREPPGATVPTETVPAANRATAGVRTAVTPVPPAAAAIRSRSAFGAPADVAARSATPIAVSTNSSTAARAAAPTAAAAGGQGSATAVVSVASPAVARRPSAVSVHSPVSPVVPSPHMRLSSFVHSTTTLEPLSARKKAMATTPVIAGSTIPLAKGAATAAAKPAAPVPIASSVAPAQAHSAKSSDDKSTSASAPGAEAMAERLDANSELRSLSAALRSFSSPMIPALAPIPAPGLPPVISFPLANTPTAGAEASAGNADSASPAGATVAPAGPTAAFEVDHFVWPELCNTLLEQRASEFEQLIGELLSESALGHKSIGITGSRRGDGRTTFALMLARRLAATGGKVVLVDADFDAPQLAARLGMTIDSGWQSILADGLTVWDGLIESIGDRLALLPLAPRPASNSQSANLASGSFQSVNSQPTAAEFVERHLDVIHQHLAALRQHFDIVVVDAGAMKSARADSKPRGPLALAGSLDAAILMSDARVASPGRMAELHQRLIAAGINCLGLAENFCRTPRT